MASVLKETLYASGTATRTVVEDVAIVTDGGEQTAAQTHDGNDTYMDTVSVEGEGLENASGGLRVEWALGALSYAGAIDYIRIYTRGKRTAGASPASVRPSINGTSRGTEHSVGTSAFATYTDDFTTDPADSQPWTSAKLAAQKMGYFIAAGCAPTGSGYAYQSDFKVEVYGPENQTGYGTTADEAAAAQDGVGAPGAVTGSAQTADANDVAQDGVGAAGAVSGSAQTAEAADVAQGGTGVPGAVTATGEAAPERSAAAYTEAQGGVMEPEVGLRLPEAITSQNFLCIRADDEHLGDSDASTAHGYRLPFGWAVNCTSQASSPVVLCADPSAMVVGYIVKKVSYLNEFEEEVIVVENAVVESIEPGVSFTLNKNCNVGYFPLTFVCYETLDAHTCKVGGVALQPPGLDAALWPEVSYVVFKAIGWTCEETLNPDPPANFRFIYKVDDVDGSALVDRDAWNPPLAWLLRPEEDGVDPGDPLDQYHYITSVHSTEKPGGGPWTPEALAALTDLYLAFDTTAEKYLAEMDVAELWVEVYAVIGSQPEQVVVRHSIGQPVRRTFTLGRL